MIDMEKIFTVQNTVKSTNVMELLVALVDPNNSIEEKREVWNKWRYSYYNPDDLMAFFSDSLFADGGLDFLHVVCNNDYKNFYEMACSLDLAGFDPRAYYLFWILGYGHKEKTELAKEAFEYDPETILAIFPDVQEVVFDDWENDK